MPDQSQTSSLVTAVSPRPSGRVTPSIAGAQTEPRQQSPHLPRMAGQKSRKKVPRRNVVTVIPNATHLSEEKRHPFQGRWSREQRDASDCRVHHCRFFFRFQTRQPKSPLPLVFQVPPTTEFNSWHCNFQPPDLARLDVRLRHQLEVQHICPSLFVLHHEDLFPTLRFLRGFLHQVVVTR